MEALWKPSEVCIGVSLEGDLMRIAVVGRRGKLLRIMDLASMTIPVAQPVHREIEDTGSSQNPFEKFDTADSDDIDYSSVKDFINQYYAPGASIAVSLGEPYIRTFISEVSEKDTPAKIIKKILSDIQQTLHVELTRDMVAYSHISRKSVVVGARLESTPIIDLLAMPHGSNRHGIKITAVTSNDVAVLNIVKGHFRFRPNEIVHVVNVGKDETRLFILRGGDVVYIAPAVQQGSNDSDFVPMLYNRIELAAENAGYPKADTVVLCGYAEDIGLKEEILNNNPSATFHSMNRLRLGHSNDEKILHDMRHYLASISAAWAKLDSKNPHFHQISVVPQRIRDEQKVLKLSWHGMALLAALFGVTTILTIMGLDRYAEIGTLTEQLEYERIQVREQQAIVEQIQTLEARSAAVMDATNTLDTLLVNSEIWGQTLDTLARAAGSLRNMWIGEFKPEKDGSFSVIGYSLTRASIPLFSDRSGNTHMRELSVQEIGSKKVYRFDVQLRLDDVYPTSGSPATVWHDSLKVVLGDVEARLGRAQTPTDDVKTRLKARRGAAQKETTPPGTKKPASQGGEG